MPGDDDLAAVFSAIRLRSERARGAVAHGRKRAAHTGCRSSLRFRDFSTSSKLVDTLPCARRGVRAHGRAASAITDVSFPRDSAAPVGAGSNRMCSPRRLDARVHEQRPTQPFSLASQSQPKRTAGARGSSSERAAHEQAVPPAAHCSYLPVPPTPGPLARALFNLRVARGGDVGVSPAAARWACRPRPHPAEATPVQGPRTRAPHRCEPDGSHRTPGA